MNERKLKTSIATNLMRTCMISICLLTLCPVCHCVVNLASHWSGLLLWEEKISQWQSDLANCLAPHLSCSTDHLPHVRTGSSWQCHHSSTKTGHSENESLNTFVEWQCFTSKIDVGEDVNSTPLTLSSHEDPDLAWGEWHNGHWCHWCGETIDGSTQRNWHATLSLVLAEHVQHHCQVLFGLFWFWWFDYPRQNWLIFGNVQNWHILFCLGESLHDWSPAHCKFLH